MRANNLKERFEENCKAFDFTTEQGIWALGFARQVFHDYVVDLMNELDSAKPGKFREILDKQCKNETAAYLRFADYTRAVTYWCEEESQNDRKTVD